MVTADELRAERVARLKKLSRAYEQAAARLTIAADAREIQSIEVEMKALSEETSALVQELVTPSAK
jgi:hypothetical protein